MKPCAPPPALGCRRPRRRYERARPQNSWQAPPEVSRRRHRHRGKAPARRRAATLQAAAGAPARQAAAARHRRPPSIGRRRAWARHCAAARVRRSRAGGGGSDRTRAGAPMPADCRRPRKQVSPASARQAAHDWSASGGSGRAASACHGRFWAARRSPARPPVWSSAYSRNLRLAPPSHLIAPCQRVHGWESGSSKAQTREGLQRRRHTTWEPCVPQAGRRSGTRTEAGRARADNCRSRKRSMQ